MNYLEIDVHLSSSCFIYNITDLSFLNKIEIDVQFIRYFVYFYLFKLIQFLIKFFDQVPMDNSKFARKYFSQILFKATI